MHSAHLSSREVGGSEGSSAGQFGRKESRRHLSPELGTQELRSKTFQTFVSGFEKVEARIGSPCELGSGPRRRQELHHKSLGLPGAPSVHR